jgi:hypothetical protein
MAIASSKIHGARDGKAERIKRSIAGAISQSVPRVSRRAIKASAIAWISFSVAFPHFQLC